MGLAPVIGEGADALNGIIYGLEGDYTNMSLSFAATIPVIGWVAAGSKWVGKAVKTYKNTEVILYFAKNATTGLIEFGNRYLLGKILGSSVTQHAHHIIPWALRENSIVQKAAEAGFHMNDKINGVLMDALKHAKHGGHLNYNKYVQQELNKFEKGITDAGGTVSPEAAKDFLENDLIPKLKTEIENSGDDLDSYFVKLLD